MNVLGQASCVLPLYDTLGTPAFSQAVGAPIESACCETSTQPSFISLLAASFSSASSYHEPVKVTSIVTDSQTERAPRKNEV